MPTTQSSARNLDAAAIRIESDPLGEVEIARFTLDKGCSLREAIAALAPESLGQFDTITGCASR